MPFILAEQRDADVAKAFEDYRKYLDSCKDRFPQGAFSLATSDWYFNFSDHRCPHDAWLASVTVSESKSDEVDGLRLVSITILLLNAYHDGEIEFVYPNVYSYSIGASHSQQGHDDWRYDEFRMNERGCLVHEIEWAGYGSAHRWIIESDDVAFSYRELARQ